MTGIHHLLLFLPILYCQEYWMKPAGKMMLGISHTASQEKTIEYEFLYISQVEDGSIYYFANPSGQQQTSFKLIKCNPEEAVFENPKHDFGKSFQNSTLKHTFGFKNTGDGVLIVEKVKAG